MAALRRTLLGVAETALRHERLAGNQGARWFSGLARRGETTLPRLATRTPLSAQARLWQHQRLACRSSMPGRETIRSLLPKHVCRGLSSHTNKAAGLKRLCARLLVAPKGLGRGAGLPYRRAFTTSTTTTTSGVASVAFGMS